MINDYIHMYCILPTTTVGDTQDPPHSVLLPSEPIKRPSQHSVAIQATPTLFAFRRGKGSTGGRSIPHELLRNTYICTHILHLYTHPHPPPPTPTPVPTPFHALSLCGVQVPRSAAKSREMREGEGRGGIIRVYFCFWFGFFCVLSLRRKIQPII